MLNSGVEHNAALAIFFQALPLLPHTFLRRRFHSNMSILRITLGKNRIFLSARSVLACWRSSERFYIIDVGLSDYHLLTWPFPDRKSSPPCHTARRRSWRQLNVDQLREQLRASPICQPTQSPDDIDEMAAMYESELASMLDHFIPFREVTRRPRPSDPWFDQDCLEAKRLTRRLEHAYLASSRHAGNL